MIAISKNKVADVMSRQVLVAHPHHEFLPLCRLFMLMNIHHLPVVDEGGELIGMLSASDVLRAFSFKLPEMGKLDEASLNRHFKVTELMTPNPLKTIRPEDSVVAAARIFSENRISALPVIDNGKVVGIITSRDIVECFANADWTGE